MMSLKLSFNATGICDLLYLYMNLATVNIFYLQNFQHFVNACKHQCRNSYTFKHLAEN